MTGALVAVDIEGRDGRHARRRSGTHGTRTYLGLMVHGFPNLFTITGPGEPVGVLEHDDLDRAARRLDRGLPGAPAREPTRRRSRPRKEAEDFWVEHNNEVGDGTLYPLANSWYMGSNVPGKPRVLMPYIGGVGVYRQECDEIVADDYRGFEMRDERQTANA